MDSLSALPHFQLKYCERCGGLWLRPDGAAIPYCPACEHFMAELPLRNLRNQRKPVHRSYIPATVSLLTFLCNWRQEIISGWCA